MLTFYYLKHDFLYHKSSNYHFFNKRSIPEIFLNYRKNIYLDYLSQPLQMRLEPRPNYDSTVGQKSVERVNFLFLILAQVPNVALAHQKYEPASKWPGYLSLYLGAGISQTFSVVYF